MSIRIVRLGSRRARGEGLRIGTVRRPPRGVPRTAYSQRDFYDVWLPELAPSDRLVRAGLEVPSEREWHSFVRKYRAEMKRPAASRLLDLLAALSQETNFAVGCYCEREDRCHRVVLQDLLADRGARFA